MASMLAERALRLLLVLAIAGAPGRAFANRGRSGASTGAQLPGTPGAPPGLPAQPLILPDAPAPVPPFTAEFPQLPGARVDAPLAAPIALPLFPAAPRAPIRAEEASEASPPAAAPPLGERLAATAEAAVPALETIASPAASPSSLSGAGLALEDLLTRSVSHRGAEEPAAPPYSPAPSALRPARGDGAGADRASPPSARPGRPANAFALLAWLLPLSAWSQVFPFLLAGAVVWALVHYDLVRGGRLARLASTYLELRRRDRLVKEVPGLFDFPRERESERARLASFVSAFEKADEGRRTALLEEAKDDAQLWRQKLMAVYLIAPAGASEAALTRMLASPRRALAPLEPVLEELLKRRGSAGLLERVRVEARLRALALRLGPSASALAETIGEPPAPAAPPRVPERVRRAAGRLARLASLLLLAALVSGVGVSAYHKHLFDKEVARGAQQAEADFWSEDLGVLYDKNYEDPAIKDKVIPLLKDWQKRGPADTPAFAEAVQILRDSHDSRSDNVLEALFKRSEMLPMDERTKELLARTLAERENEAVWLYLRREMGSPSDHWLAQFERMREAGVAHGGDKTFEQMFFFHKLRDPELRQTVVDAVKGWLGRPERAGERYARYVALARRYAMDYELMLWIERHALAHLGTPGAPYPQGEDLTKLTDLFARVLELAAAEDAWRPHVMPQVPPGKETETLIPPRVLRVPDVIEDELKKGGQPALKAAARLHIDMIAARLIQEGSSEAPGLKERLIAGRVLTFAGATRPQHRLHHLRAFLAAVRASAMTPEELAAAPTPASVQRREFLHRAQVVLERLIPLAEKAGMPDGGTPAERAGEDVDEILETASPPFTTMIDEADDGFFHLHAYLLERRLADRDGWLASYDAARLLRLRDALEELLRSGTAWDDQGERGPRMSDSQMHALAVAVERVDRTLRHHFPEAGDEKGAPAGFWMSRLGSPEAGVRAQAAARALAALDAAPDDAFLARLAAAQDRVAADPAAQEWILRLLVLRLSRASPQLEASTSAALWEKAGAVSPIDRLALLEEALRAPEPSAQLKAFVMGEVKRRMDSMIGQASAAFPKLSDRLLKAGVTLPGGWTFLGPTGPSLRDVYKRRHLELFLAELRAEAQAFPSGLNPAQKAALERAEAEVPRLLAVGRSAGMPSGETVPERRAELANPVLYRGYIVFFSNSFLLDLRAAKLAPEAGYTGQAAKDYYDDYDDERFGRLLAHMRAFRDAGLGWESGGRRPFTVDERNYADAAVRELERIQKDVR